MSKYITKHTWRQKEYMFDFLYNLGTKSKFKRITDRVSSTNKFSTSTIFFSRISTTADIKFYLLCSCYILSHI